MAKPITEGAKIHAASQASPLGPLPNGCKSRLSGYTDTFEVDEKNGVKTYDRVLMMIARLDAQPGRLFVMDNFYSTLKLFEAILEHFSSYACETWRSNFGVPDVLKVALDKHHWICRRRGNNLYGYSWHDSKIVHFLSTFHRPLEVIIQRRQRGTQGRVDVNAPEVARDYNKR